MRFLFTTIPERGHLNPLLGVAQHLEAAGHTVAFCAEGDVPALAGALGAAGLRARVYPGSADRHEREITCGKDFVERLSDRAWLRGWIRRLLLEEVPAQLPALRAAAADFRPHLLVTDPMLYGPILLAAEAGLPWAGLSSSLNPVTPPSWRCELTETVDWLAEARARLFLDRGLAPPDFAVCDALSPWLTGVFTIEEYAPRPPARERVCYLGPARPRGRRGDEVPFPWERLDAGPAVRRLVYMSLGSQLYHQPALFQSAVCALAGQGVQLVLSVGDLVDGSLDFPDWVVPVRYAPQRQLLARAALMISHGGANSVGECLAAGVPLLCLPQCNDQPLGARFLVQSGAGAAIPHAEVSVPSLRAACQRLLRPDAPERARARALGKRLAALDGSATAAALLVRLAEGAPPRP